MTTTTYSFKSNIQHILTEFIVRLQEFVSTFGTKKRIQFMTEYLDITPDDILLDVGGNTGKITESYSKNCAEVVILEPKHRVVEYGKMHRPNIKFVEGGVENIPLPSERFDKVVASTSFHHFLNQDKGLEEIKRVLKSNGKMIIIEIDPNTSKGKKLKICESILHTGAHFYDPHQLREKVEGHGFKVLTIKSTDLSYFLTAVKNI
jgi:ubiquinone/menaquinone biosynthesis C-methylase UbiE